MSAKIIKINPDNPEKEKIEEAVKILKKGGLIAFPTETIYGLGADALNINAVKKVYSIKKRPLNKPLIIQLANKKDISKFTKNVSKKTNILINKFWPGALTIVFKKSKLIPNIITTDKIAIRIPDNKIALAIIKKFGHPITGTSANISKKESPLGVKDVINNLSEKIEAIIDGGKSKIGTESTIIDLTSNYPILLRQGAIPFKKILEN
ncbi:MAG: threonylcarbamoyl-AMP synthase [Xanthomonadaceae bacterium]|nr:threonylcarbamoyl-AMP synthase [Rhodospirillaceae bacterium]NIA18165.1 threonylcarbamoyl-AMP synthase [Xanthomonadaceae bacterium]